MTDAKTKSIISEVKKHQKKIADLIGPELVQTDDTKKAFQKDLQLKKQASDKVDIGRAKQWIVSQYSNMLKFNKMPNIKSAEFNIAKGALERLNVISIMKYLYGYNIMDMIIIVFKLYDGKQKTETNYGMAFAEISNKASTDKQIYLKDKASYGNVILTYYSAVPSFISCDGEFRPMFANYAGFITATKRYPQIWNEIEEYLKRIKPRRQWTLYTSYFYPKLEQESRNSEVEFTIKSEMVPESVLSVSWFLALWDEMLNTTPTHSNEIYKNIVLANKEEDLKFMKLLIAAYTMEQVAAFKEELNYKSSNFMKEQVGPECGFKMIPMTFREVQHPIKIQYKPWREYLVSNRLNDLVINAVSPTFPITLDWFYIKNSRKGLYDNKSQYDRLKQSEIAKNILQILYEAQRNTYFASENLETIRKDPEGIRNWISTKFKALNDKIQDPINFSIENIIMSEVSLAFAVEYVGRTFADSISLVQRSKVYDKRLGFMFKEAGYDYFAKYVFEICYGLLCCNEKFGVIHGDLHLNNASIGCYIKSKEIEENQDKKHKVVYVIDDDHQYVFPTNGMTGTLIDFSRAIIHPYRYQEFIDESIPVSYKIVDDEHKFTTLEMNALLNLYVNMFPNKKKQKDELVVLFKNHFDAVFKLLTAADIYMFSIRMTRMLKSITPPVYSAAIDLVEKINKLSEQYIAGEMNNLIAQPVSAARQILENDFPMLDVIKKCFPEYLDGARYKNIGTVVDCYVYSNELKHSLCKYDKFPDFLKYVKFADEKNPKIIHNIAEVEKRRYEMRHAHELSKLKGLEMMDYIAERHRSKLPT
jgi:hypothetical protein